MSTKLLACVLFAFPLLVPQVLAQGTEYYISAARGKGKKATKEQPAKDLGNVVDQLKPGDTVHIAAGIYLGRSDSGRDLISVPVTILGGWNDDFTARDPWGQHQTILSGDNKAANFDGNIRLEIQVKDKKVAGDVTIDGLILDNGARNQYSPDGSVLQRKFKPKTGENASPDYPGICVTTVAPNSKITIRNCIVANCGPTGRRGALEVKGYENQLVTIRNNLVINNTSGIACLAGYRPKTQEGLPRFVVENNTVLFTWKYDPIATHGGTGLVLEATHCTARNNIFAYGDYHGVSNQNGAKWQNLTLANNTFIGNLQGDYLEFATKLGVGAFEDEAGCLTAESTGNSTLPVVANADPSWAAGYAAREVIDRKVAEADVTAKDTRANELRSMLGLPLDGGSIDAKSAVWMHRFPLAFAVRIALQGQNGRGCQNPITPAAAPAK
jgi:hypothetical protein